VGGELTVEFGEQHDAVGEAKLGAGGGERGVLRRRCAVDDEAGARKRLEQRGEEGSLIQSCAQATRVRKVSAASGLSSSR
jgi:hypothetical protein